MKQETIDKLIKLNKSLYLSANTRFGQTRNFYWKGFHKVLRYLKDGDRVLDLGCGNGRFGEFISNKRNKIHYIGLDFSEVLLTEARVKLNDKINFELINADITNPNWIDNLNNKKFDAVICFSVLHHIPTSDLREKILLQLRNILVKKGYLIITSWQIEKLKHKMVKPKVFDIDPTELETNDYIIDWKSGEGGYRFVHHFSKEEMEILARKVGLNVVDQFYADGKNGSMNLYTILVS